MIIISNNRGVYYLVIRLYLFFFIVIVCYLGQRFIYFWIYRVWYTVGLQYKVVVVINDDDDDLVFGLVSLLDGVGGRGWDDDGDSD